MNEKHLKARDDLIEAYRVYVAALEERIATLEAQAAPAPGYAPGWFKEVDGVLKTGVINEWARPDDVQFTHRLGDSYAYLQLVATSGQQKKLTVEELQALVGAAMEVLRRMEMGVE